MTLYFSFHILESKPHFLIRTSGFTSSEDKESVAYLSTVDSINNQLQIKIYYWLSACNSYSMVIHDAIIKISQRSSKINKHIGNTWAQ